MNDLANTFGKSAGCEYRDCRHAAYTQRNGLTTLPLTGGDVAARDAWNRAWESLTAEQQVAYRRLSQERKGELDKLKAEEMTAAMKRITTTVAKTNQAPSPRGHEQAMRTEAAIANDTNDPRPRNPENPTCNGKKHA